MHKTWRFKSTNYRGDGRSMRLTGQATTALGNAITNMQVHSKFAVTNRSKINLMLFLGDDMLMICNNRPNTKTLRKDIASRFNMQSKESYSINYGEFCSMICYKTQDGRCELGPDYVRMKFRYEVTNGVHKPDDVNMFMRGLSYIYMLGSTPETDRLINVNNLPIKPTKWYSQVYCEEGVSHKYNMTQDQVRGYYHNLLAMVINNCQHQHEFRTFSNKP